MTNKIIVLRGLPGSGKTTWAKAWVEEDPETRARVNRDDIRFQMFGKYHGLTQDQENSVTHVETDMVRALIRKYDVVVDAMHLKNKYAKKWFDYSNHVEFKSFPVPLNELLYYNLFRENQVPEEVIRDLYHRFDKDLDKHPVRGKKEASHVRIPYVAPDNRRATEVLLVDVDGTVALIDHENPRSHYDYSRVSEDLPNWPVIDVLHVLSERYDFVFMSGREDYCYDDTLDWLMDVGLADPGTELYMRKTGDNRRDDVIKYEMFREHLAFREDIVITGVFDDRNRVVDMYREIGLQVFQVAPGDF